MVERFHPFVLFSPPITPYVCFTPLPLKIAPTGSFRPLWEPLIQTKQEDIFRPLSMHFGSHKTDLFLIVKLKKFKSMDKIWNAKNYEINIAKQIAIFKWKINIAILKKCYPKNFP